MASGLKNGERLLRPPAPAHRAFLVKASDEEMKTPSRKKAVLFQSLTDSREASREAARLFKRAAIK
jgi:hypothetical protein